MHTVKVDFPAEWNEAHIYPLSDLHIGDPHCLNGLIAERFDMIQKDPHGLVILNGDLLNTALVDRLFVNSGACLDYGGYGQMQEFKPASPAMPIITLSGTSKRMSASM